MYSSHTQPLNWSCILHTAHTQTHTLQIYVWIIILSCRCCRWRTDTEEHFSLTLPSFPAFSRHRSHLFSQPVSLTASHIPATNTKRCRHAKTASPYWCRQYAEMKEYMMGVLGLLWKPLSIATNKSVHSAFMWDSWASNSKTRKRNKLLFNLQHTAPWSFGQCTSFTGDVLKTVTGEPHWQPK